MSKLIFGSVAAKFWYPDFREPKDIDYISTENILTRKEQHYWWEPFQYILDNNKHDTYVDPDFLYTIKVSHAAWNIWWEKTMLDVMFLKGKGCCLDKVLYEKLYTQWEETHKDKRINLNVENSDFFNDAVQRQYSHDWLHEFFAFYQAPLHDRIRPNKNSPWCSESLWDKLSYEDKLKCALEEVYVIATERYIPLNKPPKLAKIKSLKNLITSMTKGWFNLFLIENYEQLLYFNDQHWLEKLKELEERK